MMSRWAATVFLAGAAACVADPKVDPCRDPASASSCEPDDASAADASGDGARDAGERDAGPVGDAQPRLDAEAGMPLDAARDLDTGVRDARTPRDADADAQPQALVLKGDLGVHDPTILEAEGSFTIFSTGRGIQVKRSDDLLTWTASGRVFATNPAWIANEVPGVTDLWAPDIAYFGGKYHLYYSASTFGSRNSCIGHATATSLATLDFVDDGPVVCTENSDDYNAIDPGFLVDENGTPWLSFGSFWSGIKLIRLDDEGRRAGSELYSLASRGAEEAIEAPVLVRRDGYYYLFVSFDYCCRGTGSTYRIMVGRSESVTGPYVDADGNAMLSGGGTLVVQGNQRWRGPGHNAVLRSGEDQYLVYHAYDATNNGAPTLRITDLLWDSTGWPVTAGP